MLYIQKPIKGQIEQVLTEAGVPGVGYAVDWNKVSNKILKLVKEELLKKLPKEVEPVEDHPDVADGYGVGYSEAWNDALKEVKDSIEKI